MTTKTTTLPTQRRRRHAAATGPPTPKMAPSPDAVTAPLPIAVALATREIWADALHCAADQWASEPGDRYVREDRVTTWLHAFAEQMLGQGEHPHRHRTRWAR